MRSIQRPQCRHVVVIGLGNIGAPLVRYLARIPAISKLTLIDSDVYESKNLVSQLIEPEDVGLPKVEAAARMLRRIAPGLAITAINGRVESVPLGALRCDLILACLDSKEARRVVNKIAWRLGVPWIDAGVQADGLLARVSVFQPEIGNPCIECGWPPETYETLTQNYSCTPARPASTNAPAYLGGLAASLQVAEAAKYIEGRWNELALGKEVLLDLRHHQHYVTALTRNPECQFDHGTWRVDGFEYELEAPLSMLIADCVRRMQRDSLTITLGIEGHVFARRLTCPEGCGDREIPLMMADRIPEQIERCARCGVSMFAPGFFTRDRLNSQTLTAAELDRSLLELGVRAGDVFTVWAESGGESHFEILSRREIGAENDAASPCAAPCDSP